MNKLNDISSSAVGNLSMVDIGSEDIEGATTLALNMTKSNDINSAYTGKTPQDAIENTRQQLVKHRSPPHHEEQKKGGQQMHGLRKWYYNQIHRSQEDLFGIKNSGQLYST